MLLCPRQVGKSEVQRKVVHHAILYGVGSDTLPQGVPGLDTVSRSAADSRVTFVCVTFQ